MTKRDDAAYKRQYRNFFRVGRQFASVNITQTLAALIRNPAPVYPDRAAACIDAYTDILLERGLCADVLDWHKRPARPAPPAPPEPPEWDGEIPW